MQLPEDRSPREQTLYKRAILDLCFTKCYFYKNQFHHPNKRVMELIQKYNIPVYRTDEQKTIRFFSDGIHLSTDMPNPASYDYPTE